MNLQQLKSFLAVARKRNYTRAAEELFLTQSAVSQQIRQLEQDLNLKLFEQIGKKVHLTEAGKILENEATRILAQVRQTHEIMEDLSGLKRGKIRIGASTTPGVYLLPRILGTFRNAHPGVETNLVIDNTLNIEKRILCNDLDLAFVGRRLNRKDLIEKPFLEDHLVPIAPVGHPLASEHGISPGRMAEQPFILREKGSATRELVEAWARKKRINLKVSYEFDNPEAIKMAVISGLGISILSVHAVSWELKTKRLIILDLKGDRIKRPLILIYHKDKQHTPANFSFITHLFKG